jgi:hypothetical protein
LESCELQGRHAEPRRQKWPKRLNWNFTTKCFQGEKYLIWIFKITNVTWKINREVVEIASFPCELMGFFFFKTRGLLIQVCSIWYWWQKSESKKQEYKLEFESKKQTKISFGMLPGCLSTLVWTWLCWSPSFGLRWFRPHRHPREFLQM